MEDNSQPAARASGVQASAIIARAQTGTEQLLGAAGLGEAAATEVANAIVKSAEASAQAGGAAEQAGIQPGDVITQIDNVSVEQNEDVSHYLLTKKPGDKVDIVWPSEAKTGDPVAPVPHS